MKSPWTEDYLESLSKKLLEKCSNSETLILNFIGESSQFVRFNRARVRQTGLVNDGVLEIQVLQKSSQGMKKASGSLSLRGELKLDLERCHAELKRIQSAIGDLPVDPFAELPPAGETSRFVSKGEILDPENVVSTVIAPLQGNDAAGLYAAGSQFRMMKSSTGISHWFETENFLTDYSLYSPNQRAVKRQFAGQKWNSSQFQSNVSEAAEQLKLMELPARKIPRGSYRVYLAPDAVAEIIHMFSWGCVGEMSLQQGESPLLKLRKGEERFSSQFSLIEDFGLALAPRFNSDGELAPEKLKIIDEGHLSSTLISRRTAKEFNLKSTCAPLSEGLRSTRMMTGSLKNDDVLKTLGDGIYLSNLHYLNWSDQPSGRITGMTRFACLLVEKGKMVAPIESMRFDDTLFNLLGKGLEAVTQSAETIPSNSTYGFRSLSGVQLPGVLVQGLSLTL